VPYAFTKAASTRGRITNEIILFMATAKAAMNTMSLEF
jgi:hypothetical protein